ncbi:MAG: XRE family transcriptional regulator [Pedobacter sp.]|nr:MAG: XRE family transcriptional regulator [Pedobacter sp.]
MTEPQLDIKRQVANLIREARKAKGLTQKELGERLGLSKNTVTEYEDGKQNLTIETLNKISLALDGSILIVLKK